ncbi:MAG: threonine/serine exporter family protein, partial [Lysobacterales bacterium]
GEALGAPSGVFLAGLVVGGAANIYARWRNRPGALVRVPGIILSVPGSVGFRTLILVFGGNLMSGLNTAVTLLLLLAAVVGGLLFGNLLVPPRRYL